MSKPISNLQRLQSELAIEKSKNYQLSQDNFELKLDLASTKNNLRILESDISVFKSNEKKMQSIIKSLESQISLKSPNTDATSKLLIKRPIFTDNNLKNSKKNPSKDFLDSPQTKIIFPPFKGKVETEEELDNFSQSSSNDSEKITLSQKKLDYDSMYQEKNDKTKKNIDKPDNKFSKNVQISNKNEENSKVDNLFKNNNKQIIGNKIFEDFLIIGENNENNEDLVITSSKKKSLIENLRIQTPKILYSFKNNLKPDHIATILNCAFPFGIESKKLEITDSFSSLNEILFASNTLFEQRDQSFVFVLKCDEDIEKEINYQYKVSLNSVEKPYLKKVSLLQTSNPNHLKYCICFMCNDYQYIDQTNNNANNNNNMNNRTNNMGNSKNNEIPIRGHSMSNHKDKEKDKKNQEKLFYSTKKVFCFVSYYPFIKFFTDVIISILNYLKLNKMKYSHEESFKLNSKDVYSRMDSSFLHHQMNKELEKILKNIYENQIPCFSSTLIFPNFDDLKGMIEFKIPQESHCFFLEAEWVSSCVFSNIKCEQFLYLFLALMLEKTLVFFSKSLALLTSTLMTFICLLKPFRWPYPMIFNIPESLLEFLDSPVPILIGINKGKEYVVVDKKLEKTHKECIFVNLDEVEIYNDDNLDEEVYSQFFHQLAYKLKGPFDELKSKKDLNFGKKSIIMNPDKKDKEICLNIFEIIKEELNKEIIMIGERGKGVEEFIKGKDIKDGFLKRFIQTQMFSFYITTSF